jgi:hypothetical protein
MTTADHTKAFNEVAHRKRRELQPGRAGHLQLLESPGRHRSAGRRVAADRRRRFREPVASWRTRPGSSRSRRWRWWTPSHRPTRQSSSTTTGARRRRSTGRTRTATRTPISSRPRGLEGSRKRRRLLAGVLVRPQLVQRCSRDHARRVLLRRRHRVYTDDRPRPVRRQRPAPLRQLLGRCRPGRAVTGAGRAALPVLQPGRHGRRPSRTQAGQSRTRSSKALLRRHGATQMGSCPR